MKSICGFSNSNNACVRVTVIAVPEDTLGASCVGRIAGGSKVLKRDHDKLNGCRGIGNKDKIKVLWICIKEPQNSLPDRVHHMT